MNTEYCDFIKDDITPFVPTSTHSPNMTFQIWYVGPEGEYSRFGATEAIFYMMPLARDLGESWGSPAPNACPPQTWGLGQRLKNHLDGPKCIHLLALHVKLQVASKSRLGCWWG